MTNTILEKKGGAAQQSGARARQCDATVAVAASGDDCLRVRPRAAWRFERMDDAALSSELQCLYSYGLYTHGLYTHGLYSYGLHSYGLYSYGVYSYVPYSYDPYSYGLYSHGPYSYGLNSYGLRAPGPSSCQQRTSVPINI